MGSPATTELLFLSVQMFGWGPASQPWHLPDGRSFPPGPRAMHWLCDCRTTGQEGLWCRMPETVQPSPSGEILSISPLWAISNSPCKHRAWAPGSAGFLQRLFLLTLMDGVCPVTSSWYFSLQAHEAHGPFLHPRLHLYQEFLWNILFFCLKILSRWEKRNLARYQTAQSEQKHHSVHMQ